MICTRWFVLFVLLFLLSCMKTAPERAPSPGAARPRNESQPLLSGKVVRVDRGKGILILDIGIDDGAKEEMVFLVYSPEKKRRNGYALVNKVMKSRSSAKWIDWSDFSWIGGRPENIDLGLPTEEDIVRQSRLIASGPSCFPNPPNKRMHRTRR